MLKKFLTTIIVLAATATAWADGWGVTYVTNGCHDATITKSADGTMTLADAIADANSHINEWAPSEDLKKVQKVIIVAESMTEDEVKALGDITQNHVDLSSAKGLTNFTTLPECVKYVILPDGMTKEQVNAVGTSFDAAVSMSAHVAPVGKWTYTNANGDEIMYTGTLTEEDGITTGIVSVNIPLSNPVITYKNGEEVYNGKVFVKDGISYLTTAEPIALTPYSNRYTYSNNGVITLFPESGLVSNNGQLGVINPSEIFQINNVNISYTYVEGDKTYAYNGVPYKVGDKYVKVEGGTEYTTNSETTYTYNNGTSDVPYDVAQGFLVKEGNVDYTQGNTGTNKLALTKGVEYTYYEEVFEGPIYFKDGTAYRRFNCSNPIQVSLKWIYVKGDNSSIPSTTPIREDNGRYYALYTNRGYYNELTLDENGNYTLNGEAYTGLVYKSEDKYYAFVNGENWEEEIYYKELYVDENNKAYPNWDIFEQGENKFVYTDGYNVPLTPRNIFVTDNGEKYEGNVYTVDNNEYFGYLDENSEVSLTKNEILYYIVDDTRYNVTEESIISLDKTKVLLECTKITDLTPYNNWNYIVIETNELYTKTVYKYNGNDYGCDDEPIAIAWSNNGYYTDGEVVYANGYIATVTNDEITEYYGTVADAEMIQLSVIYEYTYIHPITGNSLTYTTDVSTVSINEECTVELIYSEVMESIGNIHLTAYVSKPGSLKFALARWEELGNNNAYAAKVGNVTALTLSGDVNYADIGTNGANKSISKYGHVQYYNSDTNTDVIPDGTVPESEKDNTTYYKDPDVQGHPNTIENDFAAMDGNALTYIDLTDAVFAVQTDMNFANVSEDFGTILLPTSPEMTLIPAKSFWGLNGEGLTEICIPYNYEEIGDEAFYNTSITHFYTTDAAGNTITNGPNTMTFSENLRIIKTSNYHVTFSGTGANTITDVYVMRFEEGAEPNDEDPLNFPTTQCQPNAFQASMTCGNSGNAGDQAHPISRKNFQNQTMWMTILHYPQSTDGTKYEDMYTDLTRVYTLNDETGYVDGSGRPFKWPKHGEFVQASNSVKAENGKEPSHFDGTPYDADFLAKHRGWIEFVLVGKSNNQDIDVQSEIEFVQRDWYTLCVPYDLTKSNLLELFGIDDPEETTDTELVTMLGETEAQEVEGPMYPDVRVITEVSRSLNNAKVTFHLSKPLLNNADGNDYGVVIPEEGDNQGQGYEYVTLDGDDPVIIEGGHPFLVRGFVPKAWDPDIKNMGMYVMAIAASVNSAATIAGVAEEELPYQMSDKCLVNGVSLPCVKHHIHARNADEEGEYVYEDKNKTIPACYHFIGTYTETTVPQYAYYLGRNKNTKKHQFFRTTKETTKWNPYSAVIIGLNDPGYNDGDFTTGTSLQNIVVKWNEPKSDLVILEGEDPARAGQALSLIFDEGVADDTTTGITDVDVNVNVSNNKVYSINGQYMGTSLNNLPKGIYIINGQKKVVK